VKKDCSSVTSLNTALFFETPFCLIFQTKDYE
jgi:hypothetical protein